MTSSISRPLGNPSRISSTADWRRTLPAVETVLLEPAIQSSILEYGRSAIVVLVRERLDALRHRTVPGADASAEAVAKAVALEADLRFALSPAPVVNATGVIIHTNLGRAPLSRDAVSAIVHVALGYSALEYDVEQGTRGSRNALLAPLLSQLTGADDGVAVNNNAAAVQLVLAAMARGREVIVSRGQAVEIGGGFRIPAILALSGARLVEVGTTNRTRLTDYAEAITQKTAAILHVHPSNFRITGFTESVSIEELVALGKRHSIPIIDDVGSGCLLDLTPYGVAREPLVQESVAAGAEVVCFSGDKLLGGPQSGIIVGGADFIARIRRHPLMRALRVDKVTVAALHATLLHFLRGEAVEKVPVWRMIAASEPFLQQRAATWSGVLAEIPGIQVTLDRTESTIGGGSAPGETLPTTVLCVRPLGGGRGWAAQQAAKLRRHAPPILGRVEDGALVLDPRTVLEEQDTLVEAALRSVFLTTP